MEHQLLSDLQTASLCRELSLLIHAGVRPGDGLTLLTQEEQNGTLRQLLADMAGQTDQGLSLSAAFRNSGRFPAYVIGLLEAGERTGHTEEALRALSDYYEHRDRSNRQIRHALTYPVILLLLMLVVIVILLSRVLPVFDQVYASLGGRLTGVAGGLLLLGRWLDTAMPALCVLLAPVLILLGEMRDPETIRTAITAAETGHTLIATLHTKGAVNSIDRIVDSFPSSQQAQIRIQLSSVLRTVVSQELLPDKAGNMVPAFEIMHTNSAIRSLIRDSRNYQIDTVIASGGSEGMISMDQSILALYRSGEITRVTALDHASNPEQLQRQLG